MRLKVKRIFPVIILLVASAAMMRAQDNGNRLRIYGDLTTDARFLLKENHDWAWNENRLSLKASKKISGSSSFYSEIWIRNIGLPSVTQSSDLYNKGIVDPLNLEIREAYIQFYGFLSKDLDIKIGRQIIAWGTADKINPTSNLNPFDMEDILDFGRQRGTDAINASYYFTSDFYIQGVYLPFFRPANLPVGIFAEAMAPDMTLPEGMTLSGMNDTILMPRFNLQESSSAGVRLKGYTKGIDLSLSYVWGYDGLPVTKLNTFTPVDMIGGVSISSQVSYMRTHIIGTDFSASIAGAGFWGEAALFIPDSKIVMTNDLTSLYPDSPVPVTVDSTLIDKPYLKFIVGCDYNFNNGSYLNIQYLHGFFHERGKSALNDYIFMQYEIKFLRERLKIAPIGGAFIVSDWTDLRESYSVAYLPSVAFNATDDIVITVSAAVFDGNGESLFSKFNDFDMFMFNLKYSY
jgi:hypothetical protein